MSSSVKERLTGAIILVALMVLLVPELLTGPVRPSAAPASTATSSEEPPLRSYTIDLADDSRGRGTATAASGPSGPSQPAAVDSPAANPASNAEAAADSTPDAGHATTQAAAQATTQATTQATAPEAVLGKTAGDTPPSQRAQDEKPPTAKKPVPPAARADKPPARKPAEADRSPPPAGAGPVNGWLVQLGVFANRPNAERLVQELKAKGFKVSVSESSGGNGVRFRVRSGPVADRAAAQDLATKLRAAGAPAGSSLVPPT